MHCGSPNLYIAEDNIGFVMRTVCFRYDFAVTTYLGYVNKLKYKYCRLSSNLGDIGEKGLCEGRVRSGWWVDTGVTGHNYIGKFFAFYTSGYCRIREWCKVMALVPGSNRIR